MNFDLGKVQLTMVYSLYNDCQNYIDAEITFQHLLNRFVDFYKVYQIDDSTRKAIMALNEGDINWKKKKSVMYSSLLKDCAQRFVTYVAIFGKYYPEFDYTKLNYIPPQLQH